MQPDDPNEQARQTLQAQGDGNDTGAQDQGTNDVVADTDLNGGVQPGGVEDGGAGGRPSEDGDADADRDEADAGQNDAR